MYDDPSFCVSLEDGKPMLKTNHDYYFQIQGQMAVTGIHICDFVVWTPKNFITITVGFDETFWRTKYFPFLTNFYFNIMLPEIVYPKYPELSIDYSQVPLYSP